MFIINYQYTQKKKKTTDDTISKSDIIMHFKNMETPQKVLKHVKESTDSRYGRRVVLECVALYGLGVTHWLTHRTTRLQYMYLLWEFSVTLRYVGELGAFRDR